MDRAAWRAAVYGVTKSRTRLEQLSMHAVLSQRREVRVWLHSLTGQAALTLGADTAEASTDLPSPKPQGP